MANKLNKELQEQINLRKELLELSYEEQSQIDDTASTLQSRTDILQKIVSTSESAASLEDKAASYADIRTELEEKIAHYKKLGHTAQADSFALELEVLKTKEDQVTAQQTTNKAMKDAGDSLFGGLITKGEKLVETMKKPGGVLAVGLMAAVALMVSFSKQTDKIGEKFGALGTTKMAQDLREANVTAVKLGRNIDDVMGSLQVLSGEFGISAKNSDELLSRVTDTSVAIGMTNDEGAKLFGTFKSIVGLSDEQAENLSKQTALLAEQEGMLPNDVMKDIAGSADAIAGYTKDGGKNIARAAIQAKKLGTNLDTAAKIADGLLDFETSIEKAMEASLMIGRQINFDKARQLALSGDLEGAMKNVVSQLGGQAEFDRLNVLQRDALAQSIGVSRAELAKFVNLQGKSTSEMMALTDMKVEELVSEDALSQITLLNNQIKQIVAYIQAAIGGFMQWIGITSESSVGMDILKIALIAVGAAIIWFGISALLTAYKIKLMDKIIGKSGTGLAKFAATGSAAIPLLLTIAAVGLALAAVIAAIGFAFKMIGEGIQAVLEGFATLAGAVGPLIKSLAENLSFGLILKIGLLALALTGLAAALMFIGVAGIFALPALMALSWFGLLPAAPGASEEAKSQAEGTEDNKPKPVHDKTMEEKMAVLQEEIVGLRDDMRRYFAVGGVAYSEIEKSHQSALENAS